MLSTAPAKSEAACSYDLDECDVSWLRLLNGERAATGLSPVNDEQLERVIERLEVNCWDKIQSILRNEEGLGIEYDENVICDVCRSPDSEEGNEMVFCDSCNICVHQACYGITRIPEGQWLCGTCALSQRPECALCPNKGGAMKATRSGQKWAHVSCALWIPEVSIGCVEKMEPITKVSSIPQSRWALICVLCRERVGACIQCSVKTCKTAYHVTCAFKHGLEMRAIIEDENADDGVKLRSYCEKHSKTSKKEKSVCSGSDDDDSKRKKRKDMTSEEKNQARAARLQEIEAEFDKHVSVKDVTVHMDVDNEALHYIYNYWKLKRRAGHNKPLLPPKSEDVDLLSHKQGQADIEKMKMFVQLRQDLERVRNLCYMVSRREKLSRMFFRMREQTFHKQATVLASGHSLPSSVVQAVIEANHGPSIYDRLYSHGEAEDHTKDFDLLLARISDDKKPELNGLLKDNPYKKLYFNGSSKRRSTSLYGSSTSVASSSDEKPPDNIHRIASTDEERPKKKLPRAHKRNKLIERRKKQLFSSKADSSSEDDKIEQLSKSRLHQIEHELGVSGTDSDELVPIRSSKGLEGQRVKAISSIYSDSDSSDLSAKNDGSQQNRLRTKASVKEFSQKPSTSKKKPEKKEAPSVPSDLIVPQRQAAKKASENLKSTSARLKEQNPVVEDTKTQSSEEKHKSKSKSKPKEKVPKVLLSPPQQQQPPPPPPPPPNKTDIFDIEKELDENLEILSYVPQRQAAKKAAEHIKSGLGKPQNDVALPAPPPEKKDETKYKKAVVIEQESKRKSSSTSTSSSSSSSSSSTSTSSSESEAEGAARSKSNQQPRSESLFSSPPREQAKRTSAKDWPFLDKGTRSESTESSDSSRPATPKSSVERLPKREEPGRRPTKGRTRPPDGDASVRSRSQSDRPPKAGRKGKPDEVAASPTEEVAKPDDVRAEDRQKEPEPEIGLLEREILERKADRETTTTTVNNKSKSALERLLDKKLISEKVVPSPPPPPEKPKEVVQEPRVATPPPPSPQPETKRTKNIEDVFAGKVPKAKPIEEELQSSKLFQQTRSIFSPAHAPKDADLLDFDILDDGFGISKDEEIMKGPLNFTYGNIPLFKEDSKEDSARETLNLVEKLRTELLKKSTTCDMDDSISVASSTTKTDNDRLDMSEQIVPNDVVEEPKLPEPPPPQLNLGVRIELLKPEEDKEEKYPSELIEANKSAIQQQSHGLLEAASDERWVPPSDNYPSLPSGEGRPYNNLPPTEYLQYPHHQLLQPQLELHKNHSPSLHDRRISQTPYLEQSSLDCMPSPSPYPDIHPQAKWADSQVMPTRRSSSSSAASTSSSRNEMDEELMKRPEVLLMNHPNLELPFGVLHPTFPPTSLDPYPPFSEPSQFVSPVSLFPPPNINTQIPFPSPGAAMFPPAFGAAFPTPHSVIPPLPKPVEENLRFPQACTAAFTSSQHNMALTAAMVNLPTEKEDSISSATPPTNHIEPSPNPSIKSNSSGKKSPSKPTRTSARFTSQKSPKQEAPKPSGPGRGRAEGKRGTTRNQTATRARGRGRGRGRGHAVHTDFDYGASNTIHNKLVGTVYDLDFDDDITNEMGDLKAMRERRKSADVHERKSELREPESPTHKSRSYAADLRDLRPPTPIQEEAKDASPLPPEPQSFPDIVVQPVLPGPVDMRTYNSFDSQSYSEANLLGAFATGATESQVHEDIDEDFEKELQSALASKPVPEEQPPPSETANNIKVSLSDSRNQLKVKIKGPIANYTSTVPALPPVTSAASIASVAVNNAVGATGINSGTSNLRRMRKKELLRQYWTQDMNMDDPASVPAAPAAPPVSRTVITIPKAVASMTSIPTRDDYRDYRTGLEEAESKTRKESKARPGALSRELRQLDLTVDEEGMPERRRSIGSTGSNESKRRGRPLGKPPKLKIKIGGNSVVSGPQRLDDKKDRIRPPKKRLATIAQPSVEDLKRESMKFRKMVMADFGEEKKKKKDKSSKHKKRKGSEVQIVSNEGTNPTKLIIRFNRKSEEVKGGAASNGGASALRQVRPNKVSPIKLKLARCQQGSGYVMKTDEDAVTPSPPPAPPPQQPHDAPAPLSKDCEVR